MKIITKYLSTTILSHVALVVLFLTGMQFFIELTKEFPSIGDGNYTLLRALTYVVLNLPYNISQFFPMACLLGFILALGFLASHSELIVMRTSGISIMQISWIVIKLGALLAIGVFILGEILSPIAIHKAERIRAEALSSGQLHLTQQGGWLHSDREVVHIGLLARGQLHNVTRYHLANSSQLAAISHAQDADYDQHQWIFRKIVKTIFLSNQTRQTQTPQEPSTLQFSPKLIGIADLDTNQKNLVVLQRYIKYRIQSGLDATNYLFAFWQRALAPLAVLVMILLAIPFVFGPLRSATTGLRTLLGIILGFIFYMLHQFVGPMSIVYHVPPLLAALLPLFIFCGVGIGLLLRVG